MLRLSVAAIGRRLYWTLYDFGRFQAIALVVGLALFVVLVATRRPGGGGRLLIGAWAIMTIILLSTSYPGGTGFSVPVIAMVIVLVASALPSSRILAIVVFVLLVVGIAAEATGEQGQSWLGPPYRVEALEITVNGNGPRADFDSVEQRVLSVDRWPHDGTDPGRRRRQCRWSQLVCNPESSFVELVVAPYGGNAFRTVAQELRHTTFLITGTTPASYHDSYQRRR